MEIFLSSLHRGVDGLTNTLRTTSTNMTYITTPKLRGQIETRET